LEIVGLTIICLSFHKCQKNIQKLACLKTLQTTMAADELTPLTAGGGEKIRLSFNIEWLRFIGLSGLTLMLFVGNFVTYHFNEFPVIDGEETNSAWDILFNGADSNFQEKDTYIYYLFGFIHTCVYIDNNPAKTCAAIMIMIAVVPLSLFSLLGHFRLQLQSGSKFDAMKARSIPISTFQILCFMYFFLCLVNSPIQDQTLYDDWRGKRAFILHYFPYMLFQFACLLMSVNQILFLTKKDKVPFGITKGMLWAYLVVCWVMFIIYSLFIWSHIVSGADHGLWNARTPIGKAATNFIMRGFRILLIIIPSFCALAETKTTVPLVIEFSLGA